MMSPTDHPEPCDHVPPLLEFVNVTVIRDGKTVLDRITITVRHGEHIAILGPNGSGKSSFIRTVNRELYPVSIKNDGVIFRVRGKDVWDVFDLRSSFGVVSPDLQYAYTRHVTGREVILSGFFSSIGLFNHRVTPQMEERADSIIRLLGIGHLKGRTMDTMSSGEARRFLIGRALVHRPESLILDEPTNSLDLHALHTFRRSLRSVAQSGVGIIMATHNLHDIIPEISRVILMKEGRFILDGKKEEVLRDAHIGSLFNVPVMVREENGWYYATGY
ncbi:MAG: Molybdate/tungstate import ATP-binding protein WtpC [Methanoregulaceae archaeon PtaU1.Bin222]|nr:MAG: Molybdate/tungstate import ATP-binding protein WtpC [Methanoregulaceae archaeon PtaU1.Bin222]